MTEKLLGMLKEKFPTEKGVSRSAFDIYGAWERIYVTLFHRYYTESKSYGPFISLSEIEKISKEIFPDVSFECKEKKSILESGANILFGPQPNQEHKNYYGHVLEIFSNMVAPYFTINTGWRGNSGLTEDQRQRYLEFVVRINAGFLENAKESIKNT